MTLEPDYGLPEIADAIGMSERWVRRQIAENGAEHIRYGNKIRMTQAQVDKLRATHTKAPKSQSMTIGRRGRAS